MHSRRLLISLFMVLIFVGLGFAQDFDLKTQTAEKKDAVQAVSNDSANIASDKTDKTEDGTVIAYYFHSTRRCATCKKLEAYSKEAIEDGFEKDLESGNLEFRAVNVDEKENNHFVDEYQLYTKSLILSRVKDGKEIAWQNLDKIWDLVGNEKNYKEYVTKEVADFLGEK